MLIAYMLQVTICLAFFYVLYHVALQKETLFQTNRIYLLVSVVMSLIMPLIRIYILEQQNAHSIVTAPYVYVGAYLSTMNEAIITPREQTIPWLNILTSLYVSGVLYLSYRIIISVVAILKIKRNGEKKWMYNQLCVLSPEVKSPFSFFDTIYLPLSHQFNEDEIKEIIVHEKTHVLGLHTFDILFMELVCIGLWPSPMVYLYRKKLREVHEFLADAEVVKDTPWENYASFLVSQKNEGLQHRLSNQLIYSQLKNRLIMMNKERSFQSAKFKYFGIVPILLMALVIFSFREKSTSNKNSINSSYHVFNVYNDGLKVYTPFDSIWSAVSTMPNHDSCILVITTDKRYFLNQKEIKNEFLEQALTKAVNKNLERTLYIYPPKGSKVVDINKFSNLEIKLNARFIYVIPEMNPGRAYYQMKDTMPTTVITAFNLKENPVGEDRSYKNYVDFKTDDRAKLPRSNDSYWYAGTEVYNPSENLPDHVFVDEMPRFPGSSDDMFKFIYQSIKYPREDREQGNEGLVIVQFIVEPDGSISNASVVKGISPGLNNEALRVINSMKDMPEKWIPGTYEGKAVPIVFTLPFKFVLQQKEIKQDVESSEGEVFTYVEEMPSFPDGTQAMYNYICQNIKYPDKAREDEISGQVIVQFVVSKEGDIQNAKVIRGIGGGCDEEALRVVNSMPRWTPGKHLGMFVPVSFTLPIKFVLQENQNQVSNTDGAEHETTNSKTKVEELPDFLFSMSPNPADDVIKVEFSKEVINALVINHLGSDLGVVWRKTFNKNDDFTQSIDVSNWVPGIYTVQAYSKTQTSLKSFVVQRE
ncbi:MAG: TonB family protein [Saprospiraceae bacterium]